MTKDEIHLLFEYDRWANNRVFQAASLLTADEFTRDLGGGFRSLRDTLVHILAGEWGWLTYWKEVSPDSAFLTDLWNGIDAVFNSDRFPDFPTVKSKWAELEKEQLEFVNAVTNESLKKMLPVRTTQLSLASLLQHLANHSTYHRGQAALMMQQLDTKPTPTDFALFLLEGR